MIVNEIIPTELIIREVVSKVAPTAKYHWGHQLELLNYLTVGKSFSQGNAIQSKTTPKTVWKQYPLIWYNKPNKTTTTEEHGIYKLQNARLIIAINNPNLSHLNTQREVESFSKIEPIANALLSHFKRAQNLRFEDIQNPIFSFDKVPNYSHTQNGYEGLDIWDAIVIEGNLLINTNCLDLEKIKSGCR